MPKLTDAELIKSLRKEVRRLRRALAEREIAHYEELIEAAHDANATIETERRAWQTFYRMAQDGDCYFCETRH